MNKLDRPSPFDKFIPRNQADCDQANALRDYEIANKLWMNTSVFTDAGREAKAQLSIARSKYVAAVEAAHPTWIVM